MEYDCKIDVYAHQAAVFSLLQKAISILMFRAMHHDESKLLPPEKVVFDEYTPKLKELTFGSDEYKAALVGMGEGLKHHYEHNAHHPEHFENGVDGMSLFDIVEMVADWIAAASKQGRPLDMDYLKKRFALSDQLAQIIVNTLVDFSS